jgi:hypothetical protein
MQIITRYATASSLIGMGAGLTITSLLSGIAVAKIAHRAGVTCLFYGQDGLEATYTGSRVHLWNQIPLYVGMAVIYFGLRLGCKGNPTLNSVWLRGFLALLGSASLAMGLCMMAALIVHPTENRVIFLAAIPTEKGMIPVALTGWFVAGGSAVYQVAHAAGQAFRGSRALAGLAMTAVWIAVGVAYHQNVFKNKNCTVRKSQARQKGK